MNDAVTLLKHEFWEWCGKLSINEITSNRELIQAIEEVAATLRKLEQMGGVG